MIHLPPLQFELTLDHPEALADIEYERIVGALRRGALYAGQWIRGTWTRVAQGLDVRATGAYIRGIQDEGRVEVLSEHLDDGLSLLEIVVGVTNTAAHASLVEEGHSAFHLPDKIDWARMSGRIKRTKDGRPYIHIPFRHRAYASAEERAAGGYTTATIKAMMPEEVYAKAKRLTYTQKLGVGPIRTATGQWVAADRYKWGRRLDRGGTSPQFIMGGPGVGAGGPGEPGYEEHRGARQVGRDGNGNPLINPAWKSSKFHGMFKGGSKGHSQYMTIRTITPTSPGWNIPARQGLYIAARVGRAAEASDELRVLVLDAMLSALEAG